MRQFLPLFIVYLLGSYAVAEGERVVVSEILWRQGGFDITHRLALDDAEALLTAMEVEDSIESARGLSLVALHVERKFQIIDLAGPAKLQTLSAEIEEAYFYVSQRWPTALPEGVPEVYSEVLQVISDSVESLVIYDAPNTGQALFTADSIANSAADLDSLDT